MRRAGLADIGRFSRCSEQQQPDQAEELEVAVREQDVLRRAAASAARDQGVAKERECERDDRQLTRQREPAVRGSKRPEVVGPQGRGARDSDHRLQSSRGCNSSGPLVSDERMDR